MAGMMMNAMQINGREVFPAKKIGAARYEPPPP